MKSKENQKFDRGMTNILLLVCVLYAFAVCYCCFKVLSEHKDFGVVAKNKGDVVWRVSE